MIFFITSSILTYQYVLYIYIGSTENDKKIGEQYTNNDKQEQNPHWKHYIEETKIFVGFVLILKIENNSTHLKYTVPMFK